MEKINIGSVVLNVLNILILKIFTLPFKIYKNALIRLSTSLNGNNETQMISKDFPIYTWFVSVFDAIITLVYPLGLLWAIYLATGYGGFRAFLGVLIISYFIPLYFSFIKELLQITLKIVQYLKTIASETKDESKATLSDVLDDTI